MKVIKTAILYDTSGVLLIKKVTSMPLLAGQVLVKILFSGICRSQLMEVRGLRGEDRWLPHLLGHEGSGVVVEVGSGVTKVQPFPFDPS